MLQWPRLSPSGLASTLTARSPLPLSLMPSCLPTAMLTPAGLLRPCPAWGQVVQGHREARPGQFLDEQRMKAESRERAAGPGEGAEGRLQAWLGEAGKG